MYTVKPGDNGQDVLVMHKRTRTELARASLVCKRLQRFVPGLQPVIEKLDELAKADGVLLAEAEGGDAI